MERTVVSDWPTPTVSIRMMSYPAASQRISDSRVLRATPPRAPLLGEGRMKLPDWRLSCSMRVLSPKMLPRERLLLGSMASTAT